MRSEDRWRTFTWNRRSLFIQALHLIAIIVAGSLAMARAAEPKKLRVITTIFPVHCFASGVMGNLGEVQNLLAANTEPHDYQLSPGDLRKLKDADIVIYNGVGLDSWITKALTGAERARALDLGKALDSDLLASEPDLHLDGDHKHGHDHQHGSHNPHFWLDPQLAIRSVTNILSAFQKLDPARSADYAKNAEAYIASLQALDAEIAAQLAPVKDQPFVTQHDAFPYLVRRYHLTLAGVLELTPDSPPSPRYLADLLKLIREKNVRVIFGERLGPTRLPKMVANDAKIRFAELDTLESGSPKPGAYEEAMRRNAAAMARELKK